MLHLYILTDLKNNNFDEMIYFFFFIIIFLDSHWLAVDNISTGFSGGLTIDFVSSETSIPNLLTEFFFSLESLKSLAGREGDLSVSF